MEAEAPLATASFGATDPAPHLLQHLRLSRHPNRRDALSRARDVRRNASSERARPLTAAARAPVTLEPEEDASCHGRLSAPSIGKCSAPSLRASGIKRRLASARFVHELDPLGRARISDEVPAPKKTACLTKKDDDM
jgi:hypothetical protein